MTDNTRPVYAVVGSGYMGGGIAQVLALSGADVRIADVELAEIAAGQPRAPHRRGRAVRRRRALPRRRGRDASPRASPPPSDRGRPSPAPSFIEEAVPEKIEIKHATLRRISEAARSRRDHRPQHLDDPHRPLAEAVTHPERFLGVHFSNPAPFIPGVELIPHATTDAAILPVVEQIVAATGKQTARVKDATGFVLNRLQYALFHEATQLVEEGVATPEDIDTIVRTTFGFRLPFFGPFAIADMAGLDVYAFCYASLQTGCPSASRRRRSSRTSSTPASSARSPAPGYLDVPAERTPELIAYRNKAYVAMQKLIDELGPAPIHPAAADNS